MTHRRYLRRSDAPGIVLLSLLLLGGCRATLEETRPRAPLAGLSVVGVVLLEPGSPECQRLSELEATWGGLALAGGALGTAGTLGTVLEVLARQDDPGAAEYVALLVAGAIDAAAVFAQTRATAYGRDWAGAGCGRIGP